VPKYSQESNTCIDPTTSKICKSCGLYLNQPPAFDKTKGSNVFWVGLSAVQFSDDDEKLPLSQFTRSGALISEIEKPFRNYASFYKTNLVKCLPLNEDKIRYPLKHEMEKCFPNFETEIRLLKPKIVFLLGKQVASFIASKFGEGNVEFDEEFKYPCFDFEGITFIPIHHPSYILVYKRKYINEYSKGIHHFLKPFKALAYRKRSRFETCD
jgi:uracil-DNA glycosylase family 4